MSSNDDSATEVLINPGDMVSSWYSLKVKYDSLLDDLNSLQADMNAIGVKLRDEFNISLPGFDQMQGMPIVHQDMSRPDSNIVQQGVIINPPDTSTFIADLRSTATLQPNSEESFASEVDRTLTSILAGLK